MKIAMVTAMELAIVSGTTSLSATPVLLLPYTRPLNRTTILTAISYNIHIYSCCLGFFPSFIDQVYLWSFNCIYNWECSRQIHSHTSSTSPNKPTCCLPSLIPCLPSEMHVSSRKIYQHLNYKEALESMPLFNQLPYRLQQYVAYQTCDWEASNSPHVVSVVSGSQPQGSRTNPKQLAFFHMLLMELDKKNPSAQKKYYRFLGLCSLLHPA